MESVGKALDRSVEDEYLSNRLPELWKFARTLLLLAAPLILVLGFHDQLIDPGSLSRTWPIRVITALAMVGIYALSRRLSSLLAYELTTAAAFLIVSVALGLIVSRVQLGFFSHAPGFLLAVGLIIPSIRWTHAAWTSLVLVLTPILMYMIGGATTVETLSLTGFLVAGLAFAFAGFLWTDTTNRRVFAVERSLAAERDQVETLIRQMVPASIADRLKAGATTISDHHADVTVLFTDIVGFTRFAEEHDPSLVVNLLNALFTDFDALVADAGLAKIKTIGDGYMAAGGAPDERPDHPEAMVRLALAMNREMVQFNERQNLSWSVRIGISTGPAVAGVIGRDRYAYDLWGDTVNIASRLESTGEPGQIRISASTASRVEAAIELEALGPIKVKNRDPVDAYRVISSMDDRT